MSAKKAASSKTTTTVSNSTATGGGKASANGKAAKPAATRAVAASERVLSELHIGEVAGEIWGLLAEGDGQTLAAIKKAIAAPPDVIAAAVGWLAREDKLTFSASARTLKITLKK